MRFDTVVSLACVVTTGLAGAQSLSDVLARAGQYAIDYGAALATVIANESYTQQLVRRDGSILQSRTLRSEIAFVRLAGSTEWQAFRSVLFVDAVPVPGAEGRLEQVFRDSSRSIVDQARAIADESARYNLGPLRRNFNAPTTALMFVHPDHRERFRFDRQEEQRTDAGRVWVIRFRERRRGTIIRTPEGRDVPVEGRLWIALDSGRLLRSTLVAQDFLGSPGSPRVRSHAELEVTWQRDERLDLWVPAGMRERYQGPWLDDGSQPFEIAGTAVYSNYRRFDVEIRVR
ncbi:MAG TPA: hypothetical protein VLD67_04330 [Vicinamibacterales bacterium]|nr:hypothetical protein [Vicinamibacterales bacterium]